MARAAAKPELEIDVDEAFERKDKRVRSIARWLLLFFVLVGVLGLLGGGGVFGRQRTSTSGGLTAMYDRTVRAHGTSMFLIETGGGTDSTLWLSESLTQGMSIQEISPEPVAMVGESGRLVLHFAKQLPLGITIRYKRTRFGRVRGELGSGREAVNVSQLVLF